jgi:hypothetical protein
MLDRASVFANLHLLQTSWRELDTMVTPFRMATAEYASTGNEAKTANPASAAASGLVDSCLAVAGCADIVATRLGRSAANAEMAIQGWDEHIEGATARLTRDT